MYDEPGRHPQPDMTWCLMARALIDDFGQSCAEAAEALTARGAENCRSPETARRWAIKGREEWKRVAAQDVTDAQARRNDLYLRELARNYYGSNITVVEFVRESMRVERQVSTLHGTDAPRRAQVEMSGQFVGPMDAATAAAIDVPQPPDAP